VLDHRIDAGEHRDGAVVDPGSHRKREVSVLDHGVREQPTALGRHLVLAAQVHLGPDLQHADQQLDGSMS
jgi:hypothetical protein